MIRTKHSSLCALAALAIIACIGPPVSAQGLPTRTPVYTLEPGEEILRPESTIAFSAEAADVILILSKGEGQKPPYFVLREGRKTGPYAKLEDALKAAYQGRANTQGKQRDCAVYDPGEPPDGARPEAASAAEGKQVIRFKEKTFGPYLMTLNMCGTPDGATAYFTAGDNEKSCFGSSDGPVISFGGVPGEIKFSPDGKNAAVMVQGTLSLAEMSNLGKLPPDKLAAAIKDQEKVFIYTIDGRSFGPFESSFGSSSFWYAKSSNDLYYRRGDDIYRNGNLMFKTETFDRCQFYPSFDGKTYAVSTYESITFSDGKAFPSPLDVVAFPRGDKTVFRWIALENDQKLVVYERTM